jgi:hypothetical protein
MLQKQGRDAGACLAVSRSSDASSEIQSVNEVEIYSCHNKRELHNLDSAPSLFTILIRNRKGSPARSYDQRHPHYCAYRLAPRNTGPTGNWMGLRFSRVFNSSLDAGATGVTSESNTFRTAAPVAQIRHTGDLGDAGGYVGRKE